MLLDAADSVTLFPAGAMITARNGPMALLLPLPTVPVALLAPTLVSHCKMIPAAGVTPIPVVDIVPVALPAVLAAAVTEQVTFIVSWPIQVLPAGTVIRVADVALEAVKTPSSTFAAIGVAEEVATVPLIELTATVPLTGNGVLVTTMLGFVDDGGNMSDIIPPSMDELSSTRIRQ